MDGYTVHVKGMKYQKTKTSSAQPVWVIWVRDGVNLSCIRNKHILLAIDFTNMATDTPNHEKVAHTGDNYSINPESYFNHHYKPGMLACLPV
jgi:hypothetical protein